MKHEGDFNGYQGSELVTVRGLALGVNLPPVLKQRFNASGEEVAHGLPPYCPVEAGVVDEYGGAPEHWMRGSATAGSFFFPTAEGRGLWLDFNANRRHKYHVAVVVSIQGVNAVTGQKLVGFAPRLERYDKKCPVHDEDFGHDRYCPQCGYKWPAQNYLADTGTPEGLFWLDGFRNQDGQVRQFVFTPEEMQRGVAQHLIGKERVFAVGVAFFLSKQPRPEPVERNILRGGTTVKPTSWTSSLQNLGLPSGYKQHSGGHQSMGADHMKGMYNITLDDAPSFNAVQDDLTATSVGNAAGTPVVTLCSVGGDAPPQVGGPLDELDGLGLIEEAAPDPSEAVLRSTSAGRPSTKRDKMRQAQAAKKLEVAAGARINQQVYPDPEPLDFWRDEPEAIIYLNYSDEATIQSILDSSKIDMTKHGEGFLDGLPVGDPPITD